MATGNQDNDIASRNESIKRNPSLKHPWASNPEGNGFVWIHINARRILDQFSKGVGRIRVREGTPEVQYAFLAPLAMTETVAHNWAEYDSIASRLAQKVRTAAKIGAEFQGLVQSFERTANANDKAKQLLENKSPNAGQALAEFTRGIYNRLSPHSIPKIKVDTPLYYENSDRRNFTFECVLVAEKNPRFDVVEPVKDLMKYSSPALKGQGGINIDFPYMFEVYTRPKEFIKMSTCALTAVQPTWNHPYIGGYPSSCNLQLTFRDLSPLYRGTIETGSVINVIKVAKTQEREALDIDPTTGEGFRRRQDVRGAAGSAGKSSGDPDNHPDNKLGGGDRSGGAATFFGVFSGPGA